MQTEFDFDCEIDRRGTDATKYEELVEKYGRADLLPMWIADMDFASPTPVIKALERCIHRPILGYTTPPKSFWDSIASWLNKRHGWNIAASDIDFIPGLKKGLGLCINYFTRPGDGILIQPPVYHSFKSVIEGNGRTVITNPLQFDGSAYSIDFASLEHTIESQRPVMMIICNPHNPMGIQWDEETLRKVVSICHRHNVILLSDEIYGDLVFKGSRHVPTATVSPEAAEITVTLGAPTKTFNIPGVASAWAAVSSPKLRDGFFNWLKASEFDTPPIDAIYATQSAYSECECWLDSLLEYLAANAAFASAYIAENIPLVKTVTPKGGFGLWLDFRATGLDHDSLTDMLVNHAHVALSDGATFGFEGTGFARLNIGVPRSVLQRGLKRIEDALKSYNR